MSPEPGQPDDEAAEITQVVEKEWVIRGSKKFSRITLSLFLAGLATFALLYCVQPILPVLSTQFGVTPAESSFALSLSTGLMALGLLATGAISDAIGRKPMMVSALLIAALLTLISATLTQWHDILLMRALIGLSLSGVAAVGMTYLSEEIHPGVIGFAMGLYISGNSIGGMSGRLLTGIITDITSWRIAIASIGIFAVVCALLCWKMLPKSQNFTSTPLNIGTLFGHFRRHWRDQALPWLFLEGFLLMGAFVTLFNYIGYRLLAAPWSLSQAMVGLLSIVYLTGSWSSPKAGALTTKFGRGPIIITAIGLMLAGLLITSAQPLIIIFIGMMLFTAGFFAAHAVASGWIGPRANVAKGQASSLYLFSYYAGSSVAGTVGGVFWHHYGWLGVVAFISVLLLIALYIAAYLQRRQL